MKRSKAVPSPAGVPFSVARAWAWIWKLTLSVAPSMGMGTLVANDAAGARTRARARALRVAFIGILHEIVAGTGGSSLSNRGRCKRELLYRSQIELQQSTTFQNGDHFVTAHWIDKHS